MHEDGADQEGLHEAEVEVPQEGSRHFSLSNCLCNGEGYGNSCNVSRVDIESKNEVPSGY